VEELPMARQMWAKTAKEVMSAGREDEGGRRICEREGREADLRRGRLVEDLRN
jgi:hypothetical protein